MLEELAFGAILLAALGIPIGLTAFGLTRFRRRQQQRYDDLAEQGSVHVWDAPIVLGTIIFGGGAVLVGVGVLPMLAWAVDGDTEGRRVFLGLIGVFACFSLAAWLTARPGMKVWVVGDDGVSVHRGRATRRVAFRTVVAVEITRSPLGTIRIVGSDETLRIPGQVEGFDDLLDRIRRGAPHAPFLETATDPGDSPGTRSDWAMPTRTVRLTMGILGTLLAFFVVWPWFLVEGEHPVRDSFIFVAIGLVLWLGIALLVAHETFPRGQPAEVAVVDGALRYRCFRSDAVTRHSDEVMSVTVEPDIIYVRSMPGHRHPVVLTFVDGQRLTIDDARAKAFGTSTHRLAEDLRHQLTRAGTGAPASPESSPPADAGEPADQIASLRRAIAADGDAGSGRLRDLADLLRQAGDHQGAVHCYRAHLDHEPDATDAWEGLISAYRAMHRDDLAARASQAAERIHLRR